MLQQSLRPSLRPAAPYCSETVVCRGKAGECVSVFGGLVWDLRVLYNSNKTARQIIFDKKIFKTNQGLLLDLKHLLFTAMVTHQDRTGKNSVSSYLRWNEALYAMAQHCIYRNITMANLLSNSDEYNSFLESHPSKRGASNALMRLLYSIDQKIVGCSIVEAQCRKNLDDGEDEDLYQTLVIPSRILFHCIEHAQKMVSEFNLHAGHLEVIIMQLTQKYSQPFSEIMISNGLGELAKAHNLKNPTKITRYLSSIQFCAKTLIHIYSGMRRDEAYSLFPGCLREECIDGSNGLWVHGLTTKVSGYRKKTAWVTSPEVKPAILAAEKICSWISQYSDAVTKIPLFSNTSYFPFSISHNRTSPDHNDFKLANLTHHRFNHLFAGPEFSITAEDYDEIRFIEYSRNWDKETKYIKNKTWHFTTHQFRRSLAYYGVDSGLISYTSLNGQLQHQRMRMTVHYTKGGAASNSYFEGASLHFRHEFSHAEKIVNALDYVKTVQLSDEQLYGGHGVHVEKNIKPLGKPQILISRSETIAQSQAGLISFKARATGGCMSSTPCHRHLINPLSACAGCGDSAVIPSRFAAAVNKYKKFSETLEPGSPEKIMTELELAKALELAQRLDIPLQATL